MAIPSWLTACVNFFTGKASENEVSVSEAPLAPSVPAETSTQQDLPQDLPIAISPIDQPEIVSPESRLPEWFLGEIPTELLRLARANCEERVHRQILADWVERYGGEEGRLLCRFFRRNPILRDDATTWQTLSAMEARLVAPFSDLVLGIGDQLVLPLSETQNITMGWVPPGEGWLGNCTEGKTSFTLDNGLWCGINSVTQEQWQAVMGNNLSHFNGNHENPVKCVSWNDVQVFLQKLNDVSSRSGFLYRLPTADEWDYINNGGNNSPYEFYISRRCRLDLTAVSRNDLSSTEANFNGSYIRVAASDGSHLDAIGIATKYILHPLGMFDMHCNHDREWTSTLKGGVCVVCQSFWDFDGGGLMATCRNGEDPGSRSYDLGFRLVAVPFGE